MTVFVFSQSAEPAVPVDRAALQARAHFSAEFSPVHDAPSGREGARVSYAAHGARGEFDVSVRAAATEDQNRARAAEVGARGTGLADLAARCASLIVVEPLGDVPEWLVFECCALLASVTLGPIVTADPPAILGVRGARERANRLRGVPNLMR